MARTKSSSDVEKHIAQFANGRQMVYDGIKEYETIPKCDKKEYVSRLLGLYKMALEGANERGQWVNDARKETHHYRAINNQLIMEQKEFKSSFWFRAYKF